MSRIYDAVKEAERAKSHRQATPRQSHAQRTECRKSTRRVLRVPLFVYGNSKSNLPFLEAAETMGVNENGCLVVLSADVFVGQRLILLNRRNGMEQECTVVRIGRRGYKMPVGLRFSQPSNEFWENVGAPNAPLPSQLAVAHASR